MTGPLQDHKVGEKVTEVSGDHVKWQEEMRTLGDHVGRIYGDEKFFYMDRKEGPVTV
jgi:hypothetical protein